MLAMQQVHWPSDNDDDDDDGNGEEWVALTQRPARRDAVPAPGPAEHSPVTSGGRSSPDIDTAAAAATTTTTTSSTEGAPDTQQEAEATRLQILRPWIGLLAAALDVVAVVLAALAIAALWSAARRVAWLPAGGAACLSPPIQPASLATVICAAMPQWPVCGAHLMWAAACEAAGGQAAL